MADPLAIELHALGEEVFTDSGDAVDIDTRGLRSAVQLVLTVTSITAAEPPMDEDPVPASLVVTVESSPDGEDGWRSVGVFDTVTANVRQRWSFDECDRYVRISWVLVGVSVTFSIAGTAHVLFSAREDLGNEVNPAAFASMDTRILARCRIKASCDVEAALATGYPMPLTEWPESIAQREAAIATFLGFKARGFKPGTQIDDLIVKAHDDAQKWLKDVGAGRLKPPGLTPSDNLGVHISSGNARTPQVFPRKFSSSWGDF